MIECRACKIRFSPRYRVCPRCKLYEPPAEERMDYFEDLAEAALDRGQSPSEVEALLNEQGVAGLVAAEIVSARAAKVARTERAYGVKRLVGGKRDSFCCGCTRHRGRLFLSFPRSVSPNRCRISGHRGGISAVLPGLIQLDDWAREAGFTGSPKAD